MCMTLEAQRLCKSFWGSNLALATKQTYQATSPSNPLIPSRVPLRRHVIGEASRGVLCGPVSLNSNHGGDLCIVCVRGGIQGGGVHQACPKGHQAPLKEGGSAKAAFGFTQPREEATVAGFQGRCAVTFWARSYGAEVALGHGSDKGFYGPR